MRLILPLLAATALTSPLAFAASDPMFANTHPTFYAGINGGSAKGDSSENLYSWETDGSSGTAHNHDRSFFLGAQVGVDFHFGRYFAGAEADYQFMNHTAQSPNFPYEDAQVGQDIDGLATLRVRAGGNVLDDLRLYGTVGLAYTRETVRLRDETYHLNDTDDVWGDGWAWGIGADHALDEHWSLKFEYLHVNTKSSAHTYLSDEDEHYYSHNKFDADLIRIGANYAL